MATDRPNFAYTRYNFNIGTGHWEKFERGYFHTRARQTRGLALALESAIGPHTSVQDLYLGYGYVFGKEKTLARMVYAPALGGAKAFLFPRDEAEYDRFKLDCLNGVEEACGLE